MADERTEATEETNPDNDAPAGLADATNNAPTGRSDVDGTVPTGPPDAADGSASTGRSEANDDAPTDSADADDDAPTDPADGDENAPPSVAFQQQQRRVGIAGALLAGGALAIALYQRFPERSVLVPLLGGVLGTAVVLWFIRKSVFVETAPTE